MSYIGSQGNVPFLQCFISSHGCIGGIQEKQDLKLQPTIHFPVLELILENSPTYSKPQRSAKQTVKEGNQGDSHILPLHILGFYETSEMGSLSDSCASVQSDGPGESRCSVGSLSQLPGLQENSFVRPRSTDEAAVRLLDLQLQRLTLMNAPGTDSRRPVSTGESGSV